jgi:hypothetical protein
MTVIRPIWAGLLTVSAGLVPGPTLCPGAGGAEGPQEILYCENFAAKHNYGKNSYNFCWNPTYKRLQAS